MKELCRYCRLPSKHGLGVSLKMFAVPKRNARTCLTVMCVFSLTSVHAISMTKRESTIVPSGRTMRRFERSKSPCAFLVRMLGKGGTCVRIVVVHILCDGFSRRCLDAPC